MPPRIAKRRLPEPPENPRPTKRTATATACLLTIPQLANNIHLDTLSVSKMSEVDNVVYEYLDDHCLRRDEFDKLKPNSRNRVLRDIFQIIVSQPESHKKLDPTIQKMVHPMKYGDRWDAYVESHPDLIDVLLECWSLNPPSFNRVLELEYLQKPKLQPVASNLGLCTRKDYEAAISSWSEEFRGDSAKLLHKTLRSYMKNNSGNIPYTRYAALIQSSGTGKSRMNDQLAKKIVYVPVNLGAEGRTSTRTICPPPDNQEFQDWFRLKSKINPTRHMARVHYGGFVFGVMTVTKQRLEEIKGSDKTILDKDSLARAPCTKTATLHRLSLLAEGFRAKMSAMQLSETEEPLLEYGVYRGNFYSDVITEAEKFISRASKNEHANQAASVQNIEEAGKALRDLLDPLELCSEEPLLVICFDDASSLTHTTERQPYTLLSELRHAFHPLNNLPFFSLFVSSGGQSHEVAPGSYTFSSSNRVQLEVLSLFPPITEVGFDEFAVRVPADGSWTLDRLASTHHIAHLGRALFPAHYDSSPEHRSNIVNLARGKVLGLRYSASSMPWPFFRDDQKLACLDVRLCLEFRGTHWVDRSEECNQLENHMRLCLSATRGFKDMFTVAPSEPLLAEAASLNMTSWGAAKALVHHIRHSHLSAGDRGELVVALLALLARDTALRILKPPLSPPNALEDENAGGLKADGAHRVVRVIDFLQALLPDSCHDQLKNHTPSECLTADASTATLEKTFRHAHIWFNHFVKVHDFNAVNEDHLWHFIVRGAAIICTNTNGSIDMLIPILFNNRLSKENVSAILIQVKNDPRYQASIDVGTFETMNPFGPAGVFSEKAKSHPPIIRMVFALASDTPAIKFGPSASARPMSCDRKKQVRKATSKPRPTTKPDPEPQIDKPKFTAYNIWCAGVSSKTFRVIDPDDDDVFRELLHCTRTSFNPYTAEFGSIEDIADRATARRGMHPIAQAPVGHNRRFVADTISPKGDQKIVLDSAMKVDGHKV